MNNVVRSNKNCVFLNNTININVKTKAIVSFLAHVNGQLRLSLVCGQKVCDEFEIDLFGLDTCAPSDG